MLKRFQSVIVGVIQVSVLKLGVGEFSVVFEI